MLKGQNLRNHRYQFYIKPESGEIKSQFEWLHSYQYTDALRYGLTSQQCFERDLGSVLFPVTPGMITAKYRQGLFHLSCPGCRSTLYFIGLATGSQVQSCSKCGTWFIVEWEYI